MFFFWCYSLLLLYFGQINDDDDNDPLIMSGCEETISCETQGAQQTAWLHDPPSQRQGLSCSV